jgi:DNA-binding transcriptional MerR regulator
VARDECYTIQQLATHARVSVRTVRHYISVGDVPSHYGSRTKPIYTNAHLRALMRVRSELEANVRLGHIRESRRTSHTVKV